MAELTLKWEKFGLSRILHEMLGTRELVDVTLACQGEFVKAHKTVLAACSPYFREIFKDNPCNHPVVILQDINLNHLKPILQFMYLGEVTVLQEHLPGFLQTAEVLGVTALAPKKKNAKRQQLSSAGTSFDFPPDDLVLTSKRRRRNLKHTPTKNMPTPTPLMPNRDSKKDSVVDVDKLTSESDKDKVPPTTDVSELGLYSSEEVIVPEEIKLEIDDDDEDFLWSMSPLVETEIIEQDSRPAEISTDELQSEESSQVDGHPNQAVTIDLGGSIVVPVSQGNTMSGASNQGQTSSKGSSSSTQNLGPWVNTQPSLRPIRPKPTDQTRATQSPGIELIPSASTMSPQDKKNAKKATPSCSASTSNSEQDGKLLKVKILKSNITKVAKVRGRLLKCIKCRENFASRALRIEHEEKMHKNIGTLVTCEFCHRKFNHNKSLCTHRRLYHTGPEAGMRHVCKICGVSYALKGDLKTHERNIHGDLAKPHQCQICFKVFKNRRYCHSHMRVIHQMRNMANTAPVEDTADC